MRLSGYKEAILEERYTRRWIESGGSLLLAFMMCYHVQDFLKVVLKHTDSDGRQKVGDHDRDESRDCS